MKQIPCLCCKKRNAIPTSKRGLCARCEEVATVLDYFLAQEKAELERVAKRKESGLVLPEDIRRRKTR